MNIIKKIRFIVLNLMILGTFFASGFSANDKLFSDQDKKISIEQKVDFYLDYATFFKGTLGKSLVEIYVAVPMKSLTYDEKLKGSFSVSVQVLDEDNKVVVEDYWGQKVKITSENERYSTSEFPAITKFNIKSGIYRLLVEVKDLTSGVSAEINIPFESEKFVVKDFYKRIYEDNEVSISSVQLCSKLVKIANTSNNKESDFAKNGYIVLPNPRKLYGTFRPFIDFMVELYGLEMSNKYYMKWNIIDGEGLVVLKSDYKEKKAPGSTMVLTGRAKIQSLKTGSYFFKLFISDNKNAVDDEDVIASTLNNFFIFRKIDFNKKSTNNEEVNLAKVDLDNHDFMISLNDNQVEKEYSIVNSALLPQSKKEQSDKLNNDGKRNFLNQFWIEQEKKVKNSRRTFIAAVKYVNNKYSTGNKKGWETDRGRIFLKAGKPDTHESILSNQNKLDHEIWKYFKNNYTFVFLDKHGLSDFRLIHSNYEGEKYDPRWEDKIEKKMMGF